MQKQSLPQPAIQFTETATLIVENVLIMEQIS